MISAIAFYMFALITLLCAVAVITAKNPVHSVLFLILAFFNASGLFVLLGAEFIAMILVIVYVGAVAVLFLFVVMMLDISFGDLRKGAMQYVPVGLITNTEALGRVLYTDFIFAFQVAGLVLLVAMIGAIVLTHRRRPGVRKQVVSEQQARTPGEAMEIQKVTPKTGI